MFPTVSIDGADNVGKTTQIGLLPHHRNVLRVGSLHKYSEKLAGMLERSELKTWWWGCEDEDFVSVIFDALASRWKFVREAEKSQKVQLAVFDRGTKMFQAVAAATISAKNGFKSPAQGRHKLHKILSQRGIECPSEDVSILLKHHEDLGAAVEIGLGRETEPVDEQYRNYQSLLHQELRDQEIPGEYHVCITEGEAGADSYRVVQDQLRQVLASHALPKLFVPILPALKTIYALGGLSESGKSTMATELVKLHSTSGCRLKIGYLLDTASEKQRKDLYSLPEKDQAFALLDEIQAYTQAHYWLDVLTVESVHRFESLNWLKTLLGSTLQIIYVDATEDNRRSRNEGSREEFVRKDQTKRSRGADRVKDIADFVLDNNCSRADAVASLQSFARKRLDG